MMNIDLSIFISCFNEENSIIPTLVSVTDALKLLPMKWEILIIDDCSKDHSVQVVKKFVNDHPFFEIILFEHEKNVGLAKTIFEAARLARGKYYWCLAGDNPTPTEACLQLFSHIGKADIIIPYVQNYIGRTPFRRILSKLYAFLVRLISGCPVRYYNGSSLFLRESFCEQMENITGFTYSAEMLITLIDRGLSYVEVPVIYTDRTEGKSTAVSLKHLFETGQFFIKMLGRRSSRALQKHIKFSK